MGLALGLVAGTLGGIVGVGTSIMLMPALVLVYGPKQAVPIMAVGSILANASRVAAWWREVDWRTVLAYSVTAMPAAALGARTLLVLPAREHPAADRNHGDEEEPEHDVDHA